MEMAAIYSMEFVTHIETFLKKLWIAASQLLIAIDFSIFFCISLGNKTAGVIPFPFNSA